MFGHGNSLYRQLLQVPLIVIYPKLPQGMRVQQVVSLRDLPRTLMDLAGIRDEDRIPGTSLGQAISQQRQLEEAMQLVEQLRTAASQGENNAVAR